MCNSCGKPLESFPEKEQVEIKAIGEKIDKVQAEYKDKYEALAKESEVLEQKFSDLDESSGLNKLFVELEKYYHD